VLLAPYNARNAEQFLVGCDAQGTPVGITTAQLQGLNYVTGIQRDALLARLQYCAIATAQPLIRFTYASHQPQIIRTSAPQVLDFSETGSLALDVMDNGIDTAGYAIVTALSRGLTVYPGNAPRAYNLIHLANGL
jgi:hypothetical protein